MGTKSAKWFNRFVDLEWVADEGEIRIYRCFHAFRCIEVLLKIVQAPANGRPFEAQTEAQKRLMAESIATDQINHPNVVRVIDSGLGPNFESFVALEYIDGQQLAERLDRRGALSIPQALDVTLAIAHALHAAHQRGVIHGDVRPENIILPKTGGAKLTGFGNVCTPGLEALRTSAMPQGAPAYMCPHYAATGIIDARCDIYSLAITLYEAIAGRHPMAACRRFQITDASLELRVLPPAGGLGRLDELVPVVPRGLADEIHRAMSRRIDERHPTAEHFLDALVRQRQTLLAAADRPGRLTLGDDDPTLPFGVTAALRVLDQLAATTSEIIEACGDAPGAPPPLPGEPHRPRVDHTDRVPSWPRQRSSPSGPTPQAAPLPDSTRANSPLHPARGTPVVPITATSARIIGHSMRPIASPVQNANRVSIAPAPDARPCLPSLPKSRSAVCTGDKGAHGAQPRRNDQTVYGIPARARDIGLVRAQPDQARPREVVVSTAAGGRGRRRALVSGAGVAAAASLTVAISLSASTGGIWSDGKHAGQATMTAATAASHRSDSLEPPTEAVSRTPEMRAETQPSWSGATTPPVVCSGGATPGSDMTACGQTSPHLTSSTVATSPPYTKVVRARARMTASAAATAAAVMPTPSSVASVGSPARRDTTSTTVQSPYPLPPEGGSSAARESTHASAPWLISSESQRYDSTVLTVDRLVGV